MTPRATYWGLLPFVLFFLVVTAFSAAVPKAIPQGSTNSPTLASEFCGQASADQIRQAQARKSCCTDASCGCSSQICGGNKVSVRSIASPSQTQVKLLPAAPLRLARKPRATVLSWQRSPKDEWLSYIEEPSSPPPEGGFLSHKTRA